jgi:hypothetical protein
MDTPIYFSHGLVFAYDTGEKAPGNDWTDAHVQQCFARRPTAANIATLENYGRATLERGTSESLDSCERVVSVSVRSESGIVALSGVDPGSECVLWKGRPGWVRVTIGQKRGPTELELRLLFLAEETSRDEASKVKEHGKWLEGPFVEEAEQARF